ncbi:MAG: ABC transporter permease [Oscillospiraceae bacterium]|nr:ABC transporter permease [Oscillospiraceae bacterium]MBQ2998414.1 ABC transporter permease [Oscillospiraceae bacterium]MBQ3237132.1 ABC transporter permease [Oscillospiraceae bacterium]MBQ4118113.1 ABC transporter permease [Oscillospiraceae bacterium]MBQ6700016.1 ABC transporter permease [Oscillospiraceae bacterium]
MDTFLNFIVASVLAATPLLFGTLGEILTEKSGHLNLGVEGMMFMGGVAGLAGTYYYEKAVGEPNALIAAVIGVVCAFLCAMLGALIYSFLTITLRANQNVTGLALTTFGTGFGNFFGEIMGTAAGGYVSVGTVIKAVFDEGIPVLQDIPIIGKLLFSYNFLVYIAVAMAIVLAYFLNKTRTGLNLRAVGESPATADAAGIPVTAYKYLATCIGGGICGLGGLYIVMNSANGTGGVWVHNSISGYGWLAVAIVIFATWSPVKALICSLVIGSLSVLPYYYQIPFIHSAIYEIFPYLATVAVLIMIIFRKKKNNLPPASLGLAYFREER